MKVVKVSSKCVVLLSGGLDSTVLFYELAKEFECYPLTIIYGQRHQKEVIAARNVCEACSLGMLERMKIVDLGALRLILPSALTGEGEIPEGHYADESMKSTVVPNRNMIMLAVAGGYAQGIGAGVVAYAAHAGDHPIYPDCRESFVKSMKRSLLLGTGFTVEEGVELYAPYVQLPKATLVKRGTKLSVPFQLTWSCYVGGDQHCGKCGTCVERREAFEASGVWDPTLYDLGKLREG